MTELSRRSFLGSMGVLPIVGAGDGWAPPFDRKSLSGWRGIENSTTWSVTEGCLQADGPLSHLFYEGPLRQANFKNFGLKAEVMTRRGANRRFGLRRSNP